MKRIAILLSILALGLAAARPSAAGGGPGAVVLGTLADLYEPVAFNHASHVSTAGNCNDCHHQHGTGPSVSCGGCHALDPASFRRAVGAQKFRPCRECHPAALRPAAPATVTLKVAYHRACFKCHRGDVGTVGTDPRGCIEICHARKEAKR